MMLLERGTRTPHHKEWAKNLWIHERGREFKMFGVNKEPPPFPL
jgi:hypothetical protein|tara:strand:- start:2663 stop:2794 length:132 start_codon:yes stop_codon:yes gene_type:complete